MKFRSNFKIDKKIYILSTILQAIRKFYKNRYVGIGVVSTENKKVQKYWGFI